MPRFYFHLHECGTTTSDAEGRHCVNEQDVRRYAVKVAREIMCTEVNAGHLCLSCRIEVVNDAGKVMLDLPFREAVTITGM